MTVRSHHLHWLPLAVATAAACSRSPRPQSLGTVAERGTAPYADTLSVTIREGTNLVATLAPDGRRVAFILLGEVWIVDADGGRALRLTDVVHDPDEAWAVAWAPDANRVAVWSYGLGRARLRVISADSRTTLRDWGGPEVISVVWHPAGDRITGGQLRGDSTLLWEFPLQSDGPVTRTRSVARLVDGLAYSPDGRALAYSSPIRTSQGYLGEMVSGPISESDIWEMELATGIERRLTSDSVLDGYPAYSPDGRWLAFLSERSGSRQIWLLSRAGGQVQPLTTSAQDVHLGPLSWLPDSRGVVYAGAGKIRVARLDLSPERTIEFAADLQVAHWHGLRRPQLPTPGQRQRVRGVVTPELSPNGRQVAFAALGDLWVLDVAGGPPRRLTRTYADEIRPRWSPDGARLAHVATSRGTERVLRILDVANPETVESTEAPADQYAWSPDGRRLAYVASGRVGWYDLITRQSRIVASAPPARHLGMLIGWTPEGDSIVFATGRIAGTGFSDSRVAFQIWLAPADSSRAVAWSVPGAYAWRSAWTRDLTRAAYIDMRGGYYVDLQRPAAAPVRVQDPSPRYFSWSADGRSLLYLSGHDIRLLDIATGRARTLRLDLEYTVRAAPPTVLIRNVRIIDGTGSPPSSLSDVLVASGRIARISPGGTGTVAPSTRVLEGAGRTLLPGLFNLHVHLKPWSVFLASYLYHGVTTIRDMGAEAEWIQSLRERIDAGEVPVSPRIFATGGWITDYPGLGEVNMRPVDPSDASAIASDIASLAAVGTDIIKPYLRSPLLHTRVSEAAHAIGLPVTSHYVFPGTLARGLEGKEHSDLFYRGAPAGIDRAVSPTPYRQDVVAALQAADACVTPTLIQYSYQMAGQSPRLPLDSTLFGDPASAAFYSQSLLQTTRAMLLERPSPDRLHSLSQFEATDMASMLRLHQAGVRIVTGTDLSPPLDEPGVALEMDLLVQAGFSPLEAIRAATLEAASCLGVEHELGAVAEGRRADLIIVDGDPATDVRDLRRIVWVMRDGALYSRQDIIASVR